MGFPSTDLLQFIYFLLPGFVAAWIFYGLTAHPRQSPFERVVEALIFTALVQALTVGVTESLYAVGSRMESAAVLTKSGVFAISVCVALPLGLAAAAMSNGNAPHGWLPDWITKRTSLPSEWYAGFAKYPRFVYLRLRDGRTLYGWPMEWPDAADAGHFLMTRCEWILADETRVELPLIEAMLIPAETVETVEFELPQERITPAAIRENAKSHREIRDARRNAGLAAGATCHDDGISSSVQPEKHDGQEASISAAGSNAAGRDAVDERSQPSAAPAGDNVREAPGLSAAPTEEPSQPVKPLVSDE